MTLPGVTPFPPEFAARYRARGYWADRPIIAHFLDAFDQFADRVAVIDDTGSYTYAELADASRACVPLLRAAPHPAIVNSASIVGLRPGPQPYPYSASKAAVVSLTRTLAGALGPQIRVNAVAPGWMEGEWMQARLGENYDRLMQRRARMTPLGRCVTAEDVAATIVSLVTSNPFVTGEVVVVDGGYSATT